MLLYKGEEYFLQILVFLRSHQMTDVRYYIIFFF